MLCVVTFLYFDNLKTAASKCRIESTCSRPITGHFSVKSLALSTCSRELDAVHCLQQTINILLLMSCISVEKPPFVQYPEGKRGLLAASKLVAYYDAGLTRPSRSAE